MSNGTAKARKIRAISALDRARIPISPTIRWPSISDRLDFDWELLEVLSDLVLQGATKKEISKLLKGSNLVVAGRTLCPIQEQEHFTALWDLDQMGFQIARDLSSPGSARDFVWDQILEVLAMLGDGVIGTEEAQRVLGDQDLSVVDGVLVPIDNPRIFESYSIATILNEYEDPMVEHGWVDEEGIFMGPDPEWDQEEETTVSKTISYLRDHWATEPNDTDRADIYSSDSEEDPRTGAHETRYYHLKGYSDWQLIQILEAVHPPAKRKKES